MNEITQVIIQASIKIHTDPGPDYENLSIKKFYITGS